MSIILNQRLNEFTDFLQYIGILSHQTNHLFNENLNKNLPSQSSNNDTSNVMESITLAYEAFLTKLTKDQLKLIARQMVIKFKENRIKSSSSKISKLLVIYSKGQLASVYKHINHWKRLCPVNKQQNALTQNNSSNQCTKKAKAYYNDDMKANTNANANANANANGNANSNNINANLSLQPPNNGTFAQFFKRQEKFKENQSKSIEKALKENEEEYTLICTFNPKINGVYTTNGPPPDLHKQHACLRLYDERMMRQDRKEQREKDAIDKIKRNGSVDKEKKGIEQQDKYQQLYEDYKQRKTRKKKLIEKVDNECGLTFIPEVNYNKKTRKRSISKENKKHKEKNRTMHKSNSSITLNKRNQGQSICSYHYNSSSSNYTNNATTSHMNNNNNSQRD